MGMGRTLSFVVALVLAVTLGTPSSRAELTKAQMKEKREKLLAELDAEVAKIVPIVVNVAKRGVCPAKKPGRRHLAVVGKHGPPFCRDKLDPIKTKITQLVSDIGSVIDSDNRAGWVRSYWAQHVQSVETQLGHLDLMKRKHAERTAAGSQCKKVSDAMLDRMRAADAKKSLDEVEAARTRAASDGLDLKKLIAAQEVIQGEMDQWNKNVHLFKPDNQYDGAWKPVYQELHKSAQAMLDEWGAAWTEARKVCDPAAKGDRFQEHWDLENQAYENLKKQLVDDLQAWRDKIKEDYRYDCDSMKKLHELYPIDGDNDNENQEDTQKFDEQAQTMRDTLRPKLETQRAALDVFKQRANRLAASRNGHMGSAEKFREWDKQLAEFRKGPDRQKQKLDRVMNNGIPKYSLGGMRNPEVQLWVEFGKKAHKQMENKETYQCALADERYCAVRNEKDECVQWKRPDCVSVFQCKIWEFKPDTKAAKAKGAGQVANYKKILETHYNFAYGLHKEDKLTYEPVGGRILFRELVRQCLKNDKIEFETAVETYKRREFEYTCGDPDAE